MRLWGDGAMSPPLRAAGNPCSICNDVGTYEIPELPSGFVPDAKRSWPWKWR